MLSIRDTGQRAIIRSLTKGFRSLSDTSWVSSLSVAGLLGFGVAGYVLAVRDGGFGVLSGLKLLSEKEGSGDCLLLVPGLKNLGNNCFLNVILQALASCKDFRIFLRRVVEESESSAVEEQDEHLPLMVALTTLLEELCVLGRGRVVASPHKVMLALAHYIENFNLTSQQDAAEAFLHLLSSLREEFSDCYTQNPYTLSDIIGSLNFRIVTPRGNKDSKENERWQEHFLGPFDGVLGSMLTCKRCSSSISLDFQFFHTLPLSPVLDNGSYIMFGCTLEDCLEQFFATEKVENYFCRGCWHAAAVKYLLVKGADEVDIEKLRGCAMEDSCDCKNIDNLRTLPWSNNYSHILKQLSVARLPKILCIHVQRVSMNMFGEPVKLKGHIAFQMVLDLSPFMTTEVGMNLEESVQKEQVKWQYQKPSLHLRRVMEFDAKVPNRKLERIGERVCSEAAAAYGFACTSADSEEASSSYTEGCSNAKVSSPTNHLYHLVAVVEHFGRAGSGHYTVYRSMKPESDKQDCRHDDIYEDITGLHWFNISDSEVSSVRDTDVLAAEASLLLYERLL